MNRDIEVEITYLTPQFGGRKSPAFSGYRPQFFYRGSDWDAHHEYPDVDLVEPGGTARAFLTFTRPKEHHGRVAVGMPFLIREGNRTVGYGVVKRIVDLPRSASESGS